MKKQTKMEYVSPCAFSKGMTEKDDLGEDGDNGFDYED